MCKRLPAPCMVPPRPTHTRPSNVDRPTNNASSRPSAPGRLLWPSNVDRPTTNASSRPSALGRLLLGHPTWMAQRLTHLSERYSRPDKPTNGVHHDRLSHPRVPNQSETGSGVSPLCLGTTCRLSHPHHPNPLPSPTTQPCPEMSGFVRSHQPPGRKTRIHR